MQIKRSITLKETKNDCVITKVKIDSTWLKSAHLAQKELVKYNHKVILDTPYIWIFKKVSGLTSKNYPVNYQDEIGCNTSILKVLFDGFGLENNAEHYFKFEDITNRKIEYDDQAVLLNDELEVFEAAEKSSEKESLADQVERIFETIHAENKTIISSKADLYKLGQPVKTIFKSERLRGLEIFKRAVEIVDLDFQNVEMEYDKQTEIAEDKAKSYLKYAFNKLGIRENIETENNDELLKLYIQNELTGFRDITLDANYVQLYKNNKGYSKYYKAVISDENLVYKIKAELQKAGYDVTKDDIKTALSDDTIYPKKDIVKETISNMGLVWDGQDWFKKLYDCVTVAPHDVEYFRKYFKIWYVSMLKQYFNHDRIEGANNDFMFIIKGKGGLGKSKFFKYIIPKEFFPLVSNPIYTTGSTKFDPSLDVCLTPAYGKILTIIEEFSINSHEKNEGFKALTTADDYTFRPMRENPIDLRKQFTFAGTANQDEILFDIEGNRRFIICEVYKTVWGFQDIVDSKQLFLQALHLAENHWDDYKYTEAMGNEIAEKSLPYSKATLEKEWVSTYFEQDTNGRLKQMDIINHLNIKGHFTVNKKVLRNILAKHKRTAMLDGNTVYELKIKI